jgi:type I restriction enzyme S subunit
MEHHGRWIGGEFAFVNEAKAKALGSNIAHPGDIVVTQRGTLGQVSIIPTTLAYSRYVISQSQMAIAVDSSVADPHYVYYYLRSPTFNGYVANSTIQTGVPHINLGILRDAPALWPTLPEQCAIATTLGSLDDKIELNRRMNETLEAMAQAIFRDWFVDFGPTRRKLDGAIDPLTIMGGLVLDAERAQALADLFPAAFGDDGLPEGWTERAFNAFVEILGGGTPKTSNESYWNGSIPWFSVTDTPAKGSIFVDVTEKTISDQGLANSSARLVRAGTTIISARGTVGNLALAPHEMTFNQSCYGLQGKRAVGDCFVFLAAQNIVERLKGMAHGSVFSTITRSTFDNIKLAHAADEIFESFEVLTRSMFDKILCNVKENRTLAATRDLLLPKLMSGEIRLSEAEDLMEAAQ